MRGVTTHLFEGEVGLRRLNRLALGVRIESSLLKIALSHDLQDDDLCIEWEGVLTKSEAVSIE